MNTSTKTIHVALADRAYDIEIGCGLTKEISSYVQNLVSEVTHVIMITDTNVDALYADQLADRLTEDHIEVHLLTVEAGEASKCPEIAHELWEMMLEQATDRKSVVIAVGGGVVGDLAGFVAATFARGLKFIQVPTTLLAQVDSSVGGKVGINLPNAKNIIGAFWQPQGVLIDVEVLNTLSDREYRAGLGEVVKYGVILDEEFFAYLESNVAKINTRDPEVLQTIVATSCRLKADVVEQDEHETTGLRAKLNYGHTFCHAFEAGTNYGTLLHGEAVAIGMLCASRLAQRLGRIPAEVTARQEALLKALSLTTEVPEVEHQRLLELMYHDKKVEHGKLRFVLPTRIGHVELVSDVPTADVLAALAGET